MTKNGNKNSEFFDKVSTIINPDFKFYHYSGYEELTAFLVFLFYSGEDKNIKDTEDKRQIIVAFTANELKAFIQSLFSALLRFEANENKSLCTIPFSQKNTSLLYSKSDPISIWSADYSFDETLLENKKSKINVLRLKLQKKENFPINKIEDFEIIFDHESILKFHEELSAFAEYIESYLD